jgi:hypothetical protein
MLLFLEFLLISARDLADDRNRLLPVSLRGMPLTLLCSRRNEQIVIASLGLNTTIVGQRRPWAEISEVPEDDNSISQLRRRRHLITEDGIQNSVSN